MIVGFNFTKINVERGEAAKGKINIANNVAVTKVEETDLGFGKAKQKGLKFMFSFESKYEPNVGNIKISGEVLYVSDEKSTADILKEWNKNKKLPKDVMLPTLNTILARCNIEALLMSREVNLPPPLPMPKVDESETEKKRSEYIR